MDLLPLFNKLPPKFLVSIEECEKQITYTLRGYLTIFPHYTDHSIDHSKKILKYTNELLGENIDHLNSDEKYILVMSCYLHDIGMSPSDKDRIQIEKSSDYIKYLQEEPQGNLAEYIREIHHELSYKFIMENWKKIGIIKDYAEDIALVCKGHRVEKLLDYSVFDPKSKPGTEYVCMPFLAGLLRLADALDITNDRVPDMLFRKYLPRNKISRKEWQKHRANYRIVFENDSIIVRSQCDRKDLYDSLLIQYENIKAELDSFRKILQYLQFSRERKLTIDYHVIKHDIKCIGFVPKDIRFTITQDAILKMFAGKRLYSSNYIAIREALQNSIDTCRLKKAIFHSFSPDILVSLNEKNLTIEDNGMGMDEVIVENYFAKLGHSFYSQRDISSRYEAIGEFGIGVLSYFLLCDYFEVETKMEGKEPLKFGVTREPNRNFIFYKSNRKKIGTKVTLFLKETLSFGDLKNKVECYIRFVEIPIKIKEDNKQLSCEAQTLDLNLKDELSDKIKVLKEDVFKKLVLVKEKIETDHYSGICGLIAAKEKDKTIIPLSLFSFLRESRDLAVSICHNGIFVDDFFDNQNFFGKIDIKRKQKLNLNRSGVLDVAYLREIISDFQYEIFTDLFASWDGLEKNKKAELTKQFIESYLRLLEGCNKEMQDLLIKNFVITIYHNKKKHYVFLDDLFKRNQRFIFCNELFQEVWRISGPKEVKLLINSSLSIFPVKFSSIGEEQEFYLDFLLNFKTKIKCGENVAYYVIYPGYARQRKQFPYSYGIELLEFEEPYIGAYPGIKISVAFNPKHPLIRFFIDKEDSIVEYKKLKKLVEDFFHELRDFIYYEHERNADKVKKGFQGLMKVLSVVNAAMKSSFKLNKKDFPLWVQNKL